MKIPLSQPDITAEDQQVVLEVLKTPTLSMGPRLVEFEKQMAELAERKYAVGVNSGTSALHLIIRSLQIGKGDEVITTPFSFIASSNCILYEGATPVFCDIKKDTLAIDPEKIEEKITPRTKAILAVDVFGHPADWDTILDIAKKHNLKVIEDSAEAVGAKYKNKACGSFGDAAVFSFYPNKQFTTGEGGVVLTDNEEIAELSRSMANQGRRVKDGKWLEHVRLGYNYRLPEMQAALGVAQLNRFEEILLKRTKAAEIYNKALQNITGVQIPFVSSDVTMSWFVYVIQLADSYTKDQGDRIIEYLEDQGVQSRPYFTPIHLQPFYVDSFSYKRGDFPITEYVSDRTIALPFFSNITEKQIAYVVDVLDKAIKHHE